MRRRRREIGRTSKESGQAHPIAPEVDYRYDQSVAKDRSAFLEHYSDSLILSANISLQFKANAPFLRRTLHYHSPVTKERTCRYQKTRTNFHLRTFTIEHSKTQSSTQQNNGEIEIENINFKFQFPSLISSNCLLSGSLFLSIYSTRFCLVNNYEWGMKMELIASKHWIKRGKKGEKAHFDWKVGDIPKEKDLFLLVYFCQQSNDEITEVERNSFSNPLPSFHPSYLSKCDFLSYFEGNVLQGKDEYGERWSTAEIQIIKRPQHILNNGLYSYFLSSSSSDDPEFQIDFEFNLEKRTKKRQFIAPISLDYVIPYENKYKYYHQQNRKKRMELEKIVTLKITTDSIPIFYHYTYQCGHSELYQSEKRTDYVCPFCQWRNHSILPLTLHFFSFHHTFDFQYEWYYNKSLGVKVSVNNQRVKTSSLDDFSFFFDNKAELLQYIPAFITEGISSAPRSKFKRYDIEPLQKSGITFYHSETGAIKENEGLAYNSEDDVDMSWEEVLVKKLLCKCEDITPDETNFLMSWNNFIYQQKVISDAQLPKLCCLYAQKNGIMLKESQSLELAFIVHLINMWEYGIIDPTTITYCLSCLK